jgi:hypothetical protein
MDFRNMLRSKKKRLKAVDPPAAGEDARVLAPSHPPPAPADQAAELGTIHYCNLTPDQRHGDYHAALQAAAESGKPIFANFVEWSG